MSHDNHVTMSCDKYCIYLFQLHAETLIANLQNIVDEFICYLHVLHLQGSLTRYIWWINILWLLNTLQKLSPQNIFLPSISSLIQLGLDSPPSIGEKWLNCVVLRLLHCTTFHQNSQNCTLAEHTLTYSRTPLFTNTAHTSE